MEYGLIFDVTRIGGNSRGICNSFTMVPEGLSLITVPIHEGEARGRGQLSFDNPNVAMV